MTISGQCARLVILMAKWVCLRRVITREISRLLMTILQSTMQQMLIKMPKDSLSGDSVVLQRCEDSNGHGCGVSSILRPILKVADYHEIKKRLDSMMIWR